MRLIPKAERIRRLQEFFADIEGTDECVEWPGRCDKRGYGRVSRLTAPCFGTDLAHRIAYIVTHGEIPDELTVDHDCFNPSCVNPRHLGLLTRLDNSVKQRKAEAAAARTHCVNGHEWVEANTYRRPGKTGRVCRVCVTQSQVRYRNRRKVAS